MPIRLLLIESPLPLSAALRVWLSGRGDLTLASSRPALATILAAAERESPDVILLDAGGGAAVLDSLLTALPRLPGPPRVLVLGPDPEGPGARQCQQAGAAGYLSERCTEPELLRAIRTAAEGGQAFAPGIPAPPRSFSNVGPPGTPDPRNCLTERELEVFWLTGEGLEAKEVATRLGISPRTVDVHRANIRTKLGLQGTHDLMRHALRWAEHERVREQLSRFCRERRPLLLVEDDEVDVLSVRRALRELHADTRLIVSRHGEEALAYLRDPANVRPFLILLDISLPRMNGPEFLLELRATPQLASLPVVVLTSSSRSEDVERMHRLGVTGYLVKPTESARFLEMFRSLALYWGVNRTPGMPPGPSSGTTQGTWPEPKT